MLRCPITGQTLVLADTAALARANAASQTGDGPLTEALLREDRTALYPVRDGIPVLLREAVILL